MTSRALTTAATREAVVAATRALLAEGDWQRFTLDAVAKAAGVTRVTVYNQVRSKAGLLDAVLTDVAGRAGMDQLLTDTGDRTGREALAFVVERTCAFWHAERAVLRPLFGLAAIDPDIAANLERRERWRTDQLDRLLDRLVYVLPRPTVLAGLAAVTSFPTYAALGPLDPETAADLVFRLATGLTR